MERAFESVKRRASDRVNGAASTDKVRDNTKEMDQDDENYCNVNGYTERLTNMQ